LSAGRVLFVGCGPGAPDLLTVRAVRAIEEADIVIWNRGLLAAEALAAHVRPDAEIVEWPPATQRDVEAAYDRALAEDLVVVRLKGGDPTLFGALQPELSGVHARGLGCEIVPGISAVSAAGAALGCGLPSSAGALLIVGAHTLTSEDDEAPRSAVYGNPRDPLALQRALLGRGLTEQTPCTVAVELSRRDEMLVSCTLAELAETLEDIGRGVLMLVVADAPGRRA
jgi:precorrin-4/cobalt-precorrin-4 C11-methyltransferase